MLTPDLNIELNKAVESNNKKEVRQIVYMMCTSGNDFIESNFIKGFIALSKFGDVELIKLLNIHWYKALNDKFEIKDEEQQIKEIDDPRYNIHNEVIEILEMEIIEMGESIIQNYIDDRAEIIEESIKTAILYNNIDIAVYLPKVFYHNLKEFNLKMFIIYSIFPELNRFESNTFDNLLKIVDLKWEFNSKKTVPMILAEKGSHKFLKFLIEEKGINYAEIDENGNSILSYALYGRDKKTISYILSIDPDHFVSELLSHGGEYREYNLSEKSIEKWMI